MSAPADKTIVDLAGSWVFNKSLSDSTEPVLSLQGIGWLMRKAISAAGLTLVFKVDKGAEPGEQPGSGFEPAAPATEDSKFYVIHFDQIVSGGLKGTAETRVMDGLVRTHSDWLFGSVEGQNLLRPFADIIALDDEFLSGKVKDRGPWIEDDQYLWTRAVSPNGWIAVQVWGFQDVTVGGKQERRFCRNVVVTKGGQKAQIRMVYDYSPTA